MRGGRVARATSRAFVSRTPASASPSVRRCVGAYSAGALAVLVCSDPAARGLDGPGVRAALSYDAQADARKYVHSARRTARAGSRGAAWTLLESQEARWFRRCWPAWAPRALAG